VAQHLAHGLEVVLVLEDLHGKGMAEVVRLQHRIADN
jgi:hypothetical protein